MMGACMLEGWIIIHLLNGGDMWTHELGSCVFSPSYIALPYTNLVVYANLQSEVQ
jgi:hypothetical protein